MSEAFLSFFPENGDVNVSVMWLIIAVAFILQVNIFSLSRNWKNIKIWKKN